MVGKILCGLLGGLLVAILGSFLATLITASNPEAAGQLGAIAFFVFWAIALVLAVTASRAGKSWRRLLLTSSVLSFALPLSSFIFTGQQVTQAAEAGGDYAGAAAAGAMIGGGLITAAAGFLGFFLGVIFLIIGLLVGRDKQVIIVKEGEIPKEA